MEIIIKSFIIIIGLAIGKFLSIFIYKIPDNKLKIIDLIRKNIYHKEKNISRELLVQIITTILFLLIYNYYGINSYTIYILVLVSILIVISFIDIDHYIIPDSLIIFGIIFIILFNTLIDIINFKDIFLGGLICGGSVLIFTCTLEFFIKKEVMGGGDVKLFFMIGMFLGVKGGVITIILSIYLGAIYGIGTIIYRKIKKIEYNSMIPYGPFISLAAIVYILYGQIIIDLYKQIFTI